jgi:hypothetical protein
VTAVDPPVTEPQRWPAVCDAFGLGTPRRVRLVGHRTHRVWELRTDRGRYAVKQVDLAVYGGDESWIDATIDFELAALSAGVSAPRPVPATNGSFTARLPSGGGETRLVRIHEWVDGQMCDRRRPDLTTAWHAGRQLALMHAVRQPSRWRLPWGLHTAPTATELAELTAAAYRARCPWAAELDRTRPALGEVELLLRQRLARPYRIITAHRDLTPRNVLAITASRALTARIAVLDWDTAGPWMAEDELASVVVEWAGGTGAHPRPEIARAVLDGYRDAGAPIDVETDDVFATWLAKNAQWLTLQIRRTLGRTPGTTEQIRSAEASVGGLLRQTRRAIRRRDRWLDWWEGAKT